MAGIAWEASGMLSRRDLSLSLMSTHCVIGDKPRQLNGEYWLTRRVFRQSVCQPGHMISLVLCVLVKGQFQILGVGATLCPAL